ncbi:MAG: nicotinate-nucleotide adenylyltransferase [Geminicoccaceae bacterium]
MTRLFEHSARPRLRIREEKRHEPLPPVSRKPAIGLLGGSFNPAHEGHRHISLEALRLLGLDEVWWLVSPQNPLKSRKGMAPLEDRLASARRVAMHPRIRVSDIERRLGTVYTVDTVARLKASFHYTFVWLIGADNLVQMVRWRRWLDLAAMTPIAVFDRTPYSYGAVASKAASVLRGSRLPECRANRLIRWAPPVWTYIPQRTISALGATAGSRPGGRSTGEPPALQFSGNSVISNVR